MSEKDKHITIQKDTATKNDLDFSFLKTEGLKYIEQFSGNLWTDYNSHDPGITMLEMLSYAITDLGSRINLPIENILAPENSEALKLNEQFFKATQILPSKPVTEKDYRKLFIDLKGVKNCWLKPFEKTVFVDCLHDKLAYKNSLLKKQSSNFNLKGLNSVIVDVESSVERLFTETELKSESFKNLQEEELQKEIKKRTQKEFEKIKNEIRKLYHENRNLCEDLVEISKVETHPVSVCASIDVHPDADEELVHAKVLRVIDNYFSPSIKFYSLKQMFEKGYTTDEIFDGPVLKNGFIDPGELDAAGLRKEVRLSDIMQLIMAIEGVNVIKEISITDCKNKTKTDDEWLIKIDDWKKPVRCIDSAYSYYKGVLPVNINSKKVNEYIAQLDAGEKAEQAKATENRELNLPKADYLNTGETTTIQNDFPETYGIGEVGLSLQAKTARKSQAKQLKAYLLFFDQILATYFAHLGKVKDLLSVDNQLKKTYFTQAVSDLKDFNELVKEYDPDPEKLTGTLLSELDDDIKRRNILLNHLIARFSEEFSNYAFLMKQLYGNSAELVVVNSKQKFLSEYGEIVDKTGAVINRGISNWRGTAFNYYNQPVANLWNTDNVSGVQKRVARLAGIKDYTRRNLSESFVEVYNLIDSDNKKVYRWRIRNIDNEIVLSSTEDYKITRLAEEELYLAVVRIIETPAAVVEKAFEKTVKDEQEIGNFEIQVSAGGKYSFDIINLDAPANSTRRIIARQFTYYNSQDDLKKAMLAIIKFMTTDFTEEGMFVVEHVLLLPNETGADIPLKQFMPVCTDRCKNCEPVDPYSFRVTVVLPGWTYRFSNPDFRNFLEELIRKELPAHVLARVCWIGYRKNSDEAETSEMQLFEKKYKQFLLEKTKLNLELKSGNFKKQKSERHQKLNKRIEELNKILTKLNSIYPSGNLIDCDNEDDELEGRIVLGRTNIGNL